MDSSGRGIRGAAGVLGAAAALLALSSSAVAATPVVHWISTKAASRGVARAKSSSIRVADAADLELRTNGKILAVDPREGRYSCSGTAINTPSKSIVLTAGHCAIENGNEGRSMVFVPAYDHGIRPFGTFEVSAVYVTKQWRHGQNPDFDVAGLKVEPNELGALTDVVGGRGYEVSRPRTSTFQIFGYPAAAARGEELRSCRAHGLGSDPFTFGFAGPPTLPTSCDMAAGASGGAWIADGQYVNGITSYSYVGRPTRMYSPYFGPQIGAFLRRLP